MAQVIFGGNAEFDTLAYAQPHPSTLQFLSQQAQMVSQNFTQAAQAFAQTAVGVFDFIDYSRVAEMGRGLARKVRGLWDLDEIRSLITIEELQSASLASQRYMMACPEVRTLYHGQQCNGFHGSYVDMEPGFVGEQHYDYRRAMQGLVVETTDSWQATTYFDDLFEGDRELLLDEQIDIQEMWASARYFIRQGKFDPTSPTNDPL